MPVSQITIDAVLQGERLPALTFHVTATRLIAGALASRDYSPLHHDSHYVTNVVGQRDIFANTQFQAALFERYLSDWSGPSGRIARMKFKMISSVFAGDSVVLSGTVEEVIRSGPCGAAARIIIVMTTGDRTATTCEVLYALPAGADQDPWLRCGGDWQQPA